MVTVWSLKNGKSIYSWKTHEDANTQMNNDSTYKIFITGTKDKIIIFWKFIEKRVNQNI